MDQLAPLIHDLALILICAGIMTLIFKKLGQPLVLGYIVAGFIASPHFTFTPSVSAYGETQNDKIDRLIAIVETYLPQFGHIELDGDVVANAVNRRLGDTYYSARRSNA